jgi:hypothetical protein
VDFFFQRLDKHKSKQDVSGRKNQISEHMIPVPLQCVVHLQAVMPLVNPVLSSHLVFAVGMIREVNSDYSTEGLH